MSPQTIREQAPKKRVEIMDPVTKAWFNSKLEPYFSNNDVFAVVMVGGLFDTECKWDALFVDQGREEVLYAAIEQWDELLNSATKAQIPNVVQQIRNQKIEYGIRSIQIKIRTNGREQIEVCVSQPFNLIIPDKDSGIWEVQYQEVGRDWNFLTTGGDIYITGISRKDKTTNKVYPPHHGSIVRGPALLKVVEEMKQEHAQNYRWSRFYYKSGAFSGMYKWESSDKPGCEFWYMQDKGRNDGRIVWKQLAYVSESTIAKTSVATING
jgi:hypothetical protein